MGELHLLISGIESTRIKGQKLIHTFMDELHSALKQSTIPPEDFRVRMYGKENAVVVYGKVDIRTLKIVLADLRKRKTVWNWEEPEYIEDEGLEDRLGPAAGSEKLEDYRQRLSDAHDRLNQVREESKEYEKQCEEAKTELSKAEGQLKYFKLEYDKGTRELAEKSREVSYNQTEIAKLQASNSELAGQIGSLEKRLSESGIAETDTEQLLRKVKSDITKVGKALYQHFKPYVQWDVLNKLDTLLAINSEPDREKSLRAAFAEVGIEVPEAQTVDDFLSNIRVEWEQTPEYQQRIKDYNSAVKAASLWETYQQDGLPASLSELPEDWANELIKKAQATYDANKKVIAEFKSLEDQYGKRQAAIGDVETILQEHALYDKVKKKAKDIEIDLPYLIAYEEPEDKPMVKVSAPAGKDDKHLGDFLLKKPIQELSRRYSVPILSSHSTTDVIIPADNMNAGEIEDALMLAKELVREIKPAVEFLGPRVKIITLHSTYK